MDFPEPVYGFSGISEKLASRVYLHVICHWFWFGDWEFLFDTRCVKFEEKKLDKFLEDFLRLYEIDINEHLGGALTLILDLNNKCLCKLLGMDHIKTLSHTNQISEKYFWDFTLVKSKSLFMTPGKLSNFVKVG